MIRSVLTFALAAQLSWAALANAATTPDAADWVPASALAAVTVTDMDELLRQFDSSAISKTLTDKDLRQSIGQMGMIRQLLDAFAQRAATALQTPVESLKSPLGGPLALFVVAPDGAEPRMPQIAVVAGLRDVPLARQYFTAAIGRFREVSDRHESIAAGGTVIEHFTRKPRTAASAPVDEAIDLGDPSIPNVSGAERAAILEELLETFWTAEMLPESLALCLAGDRLLVSTDASLLERVLSLDGGGAKLSGVPSYELLQTAFRQPGVLRVWISGPEVVRLLRARGGPVAEESLRMIGASGIDGLIGTMDWGSAEAAQRYEFLLLADEPREGLCALLAPPDAEPLDAGWTPGSELLARLSVPPSALLDRFEAMLRLSDPTAADAMRGSLEAAQMGAASQPVNLRRELIDELGAPVEFRISLGTPPTPDSLGMLVTAKVGASDRVLGILARAVEAFPGVLIEQDSDGQREFAVPLIDTLVAIRSDTLFCGTTGAVRQAMTPGSTSAPSARGDDVARLRAMHPERAWLRLYFDSRALIHAAFDVASQRAMLQSYSLTRPGVWAALAISSQLTQGMTPEELTAARSALPPIGPEMTSVTTEAEGVRLLHTQLRVPRP